MKHKLFLKIHCSHCNGTGWQRTKHLQAILDRLRKHGPATARELADAAGVRVTALHNRLSTLHELGMIAKDKRTKAWRYL